MTAAIFGLFGVLLGGVLNGGITWALDMSKREYRPVLARAMTHDDLIRIEFAYRGVDELRRLAGTGRHPGVEDEHEETIELLRDGLETLLPLAGRRDAPRDELPPPSVEPKPIDT